MDTYTLPTRIDFTDTPGKFTVGRGLAGWTVYTFATRAERATFMARNPHARMPCWSRIEKPCGCTYTTGCEVHGATIAMGG